MDALVYELRRQKASGANAEAIIETTDEDEQGTTKWQVALLPLLANARLILSRRLG